MNNRDYYPSWYKKEFQEWVKKRYIKYLRNNKKTTNTKNTKKPFLEKRLVLAKPKHVQASLEHQKNKKIFKPFPYQEMLRDFMSDKTPYRGILLYHGLGSGKTCTSITIAEGMKDVRKIIVILPASLKSNFVNDGLKFCGDPKYQTNNGKNKIDQHYVFVSSNSSNTLKQLENIGSLDNSVIIIDECHNLVSRMASSLNGVSKQGKNIYELLMNAKNTKFVCMSGSPIINEPFEIGILFNILRGYMYVNYFKIKNLGEANSSTKLEQKLYEEPEAEYVKAHIPQSMVEVIFRSNKPEDIDDFIESAREQGVDLIYDRQAQFTAFPIEKEVFDQYFVDNTTNPNIDQLKNVNLFARRSLALVSYYQVSEHDFPKTIVHPFINCDMSQYQFKDYMWIRQLERQKEISSARRMKLSSKKDESPTSLMRIYSREVSNFVFPPEIKRPYPRGTKKLLGTKNINKNSNSGSGNKNKNNNSKSENKNKNNNNNNSKSGNNNNKNNNSKSENNKLLNVENKEYEVNQGEMKDKIYEKQINDAITKLANNKEKYLNKKALETYSPKMLKILEQIEKYPKKLNFVYSQFTKMEGITIFGLVLEANGFVKFNSKEANKSKKAYALYTGMEDQDERTKILQVFNSPENKYGDKISVLLSSSAGSEGLDLKCVRQIHIMEPYWNEVRTKQIIGRGVRRNSHALLPPDERTVEVFRYMAILSPKQKAEVPTKERITTDEYIYRVARKKEGITNEILKLLKEIAIDCAINKIDPDIQCFTFKSDGLASHPDIVKNRSLSTEGAMKKVSRKAFLSKIDENGQVWVYDKKKKKYYKISEAESRVGNGVNTKKIKWSNKYKKHVIAEPHKQVIYDLNSIKKKSPIIIAKFNKNGIIKT
jgi:superfamily II DNA or RNA helicase